MSLSSKINQAEEVVVLQADNPDGDSLASALALEEILENLGKKVGLYCGVDIPGYLKYMEGWSRVTSRLPNKFDLSIMVDNPSLSMLEKLAGAGEISWLKSKPMIIIDHHETESDIEFSDEVYIEPAASTTQLIYKLAQENNWPLTKSASELIVYGILSDTLGLTTPSTGYETVKVVAECVANGADLAQLSENRRKLQKKQPELIKYKAKLLERIAYKCDGKLAYLVIPWEEIEKYSPLYNPPMLVIDEMKQIENVAVSVVFKLYPGGRITGKIRSNNQAPLAGVLAEKFGGGGHSYASGFRIEDGRNIDQVIEQFSEAAQEVLSDA